MPVKQYQKAETFDTVHKMKTVRMCFWVDSFDNTYLKQVLNM